MSPIVIGVAGGSGSGKTTVVRRIVESIGSDQVTVLDHDHYYRDRNDLRLEERAALNYDHPDSLETDLLAAARARGLATADGLGMLLHQAVRGFSLWFGVRPEVTAELRALVEADLVRPKE